MRSKIGYLGILIIGMLFLSSCAKLDTNLVLDQNYLFVADVLEYCQGSCNDRLQWEGSDILVKGHIPDVENDSIVTDYYNNGQFYFSDIRNGMFIEIRITDNRDAIFEILYSLNKQDMVYIHGTSESVIVNEGNECSKGVIIELSKSENIQINL